MKRRRRRDLPKDPYNSRLLSRKLTHDEWERASRLLISKLQFPLWGVSNAMKATFKRWGVKTVLDAAYLSHATILQIQSVGRKRLELLRNAVEIAISKDPTASLPARSSPKQKAQLYYSPLLERTLSEQETAVLDGVSVDAVIQDVRAHNAFRELGITTALAAIRVTPERLMSVRNAGKKTVSKSAAEIESAIISLGTQPERVPLTAKDVERY